MVSETDTVIASLIETLNQVRGLLKQGPFLAADANEAIMTEALARIANVLGLRGVQRWLDTGRIEC